MNVYVIGDSISVHYGPYLEKALVGVAAYTRKGGPDAAGTDWENPAEANGGDSNLVRTFLSANLPLIAADTLLLNCGLHDLRVDRSTGAHQVDLAAYERNLIAIIALIQAHQIKPVWITTTPLIDAVHNRHDLPYRRFRRDVVTYNQVAAEVMRTQEVPVIDLFGFMVELGPDIYLDHVHLKPEIRQQQAAFIAAELRTLTTPKSGANGLT